MFSMCRVYEFKNTVMSIHLIKTLSRSLNHTNCSFHYWLQQNGTFPSFVNNCHSKNARRMAFHLRLKKLPVLVWTRFLARTVTHLSSSRRRKVSLQIPEGLIAPFKMQTCRLRCGLLLALVILSSVLAPVGGCDFAQSACGAYTPGDVILGILLPCHQKVKAIHERIRPDAFQCAEWVWDLMYSLYAPRRWFCYNRSNYVFDI